MSISTSDKTHSINLPSEKTTFCRGEKKGFVPFRKKNYCWKRIVDMVETKVLIRSQESSQPDTPSFPVLHYIIAFVFYIQQKETLSTAVPFTISHDILSRIDYLQSLPPRKKSEVGISFNISNLLCGDYFPHPLSRNSVYPSSKYVSRYSVVTIPTICDDATKDRRNVVRLV